MAKDLLLEIGTEEIPARFMTPVLQQLEQNASVALAQHRLSYDGLKTYGTPRRLALLVTGLAELQADLSQEVKGPAVKVAFDAGGKPTKAAEGFARSQGVDVETLVVRETPQGAYVFAVRQERGGPAAEVLPGLLSDLVDSLSFPKPMRWAYYDKRFARPIRWLVALLGETVIPLEIAGVHSGRLSRGHRFLGSQGVEIRQPAEYLSALEANYVIADQNRRKAMIWEQINQLAQSEGGRVEEDPELLDELTHLLEYPTALCGSFAQSYLHLPQEVLITPMKEHQRYFPVLDEGGRLLPIFITIRNGTRDGLDVVRAGNEKVLRARLADAAFFYQEDLKTPLADRVEKLQAIVFQESLGTLYQKTQRIQRLTGYLGELLGYPAEAVADARRCGWLAKADLVTNMVYEFPELQGIMGAYYAAHSGEKPGVCEGIREHYQPRFAGDVLPTSPAGTLVALADKMDNIVGCFAIGIQPTGSQDPYALRRQALGICHILLQGGFSLSLRELVTAAYQGYAEQVTLQLPEDTVVREVSAFFQQRMENILEDRGIGYDVAKAVLAAGADNPTNALRRAEALARFRQSQGFDALLVAFNRVYNLAKQVSPGLVDPAVFTDGVEHDLFQAFTLAQARAGKHLASDDYYGALEALASIKEAIDGFFGGVMVMTDDHRIRQNRLALLKSIADYMGSIADLSRIVP